MSDTPPAPVAGARFEGFCTLWADDPVGMISLRADLGLAKLARAVRAVTGAQMPARLGLTRGARGRVAWMSPDELLLLLPRARVAGALGRLEKALAPSHVLLADVSDARAVFVLHGARWREVLGKLGPTDLRALAPGDFRRTRLGQVAAAVAVSGPERVEILCWRSVAGYMFALLSDAARPGSEVFAPAPAPSLA